MNMCEMHDIIPCDCKVVIATTAASMGIMFDCYTYATGDDPWMLYAGYGLDWERQSYWVGADEADPHAVFAAWDVTSVSAYDGALVITVKPSREDFVRRACEQLDFELTPEERRRLDLLMAL